MRNKTLYLTIIISATITFGLTKVWDSYNSNPDPSESISSAEGHTGHNENAEEKSLRLSQEVLEEFGVQVELAGPGILQLHRDLPGEIAIDPDRLAHIGPRFPGIVKKVYKGLGDYVKKDEVLAIIESNESLTSYEVISLMEGTVIEMHLTQGEMVNDDDHAFMVANLGEVWVNLSVYQKDLPFIKIGQTVEIDLGAQLPKVSGTISYISPVLDEHTRTATARVILPNPDRKLRPGLFVTGKVIVEKYNVPIIVPKTALQIINEQTVIFVKTDNEFQPQPVHIGKTNNINVEIISGINSGQEYVSLGGFTLKAQLAKSSFGDEH